MLKGQIDYQLSRLELLHKIKFVFHPLRMVAHDMLHKLCLLPLCLHVPIHDKCNHELGSAN